MILAMGNSENMFHLIKDKFSLPEYQLINADKSEVMFKNLFSSFDLKESDEEHLDGNKVRKIGLSLGLIDESNFLLSEQLTQSGISPPNEIYLFFLNFNTVYRFKVSDTDAFFDDIYYPGANDIMISDEKHSWMLYVDHDCHLYEFRAN